MGSNEKPVLILLHDDDDDEAERKKNVDETIQMLKKKDTANNEGAHMSDMEMNKEASHAEMKKKEAVGEASDEGLLLRGPREDLFAEKRNFDNICDFGNDMYLTKKQQDYLEEICVYLAGENLFCNLYVHRMTKSNVIHGKCKLDIGAKFSNKYLLEEVKKPVMVPVESRISEEKINIKMMIGQGKNNVTMTAGWGKAVKEFKICEDDIWVLNFGTDSVKGDLELLMVRLPLRK